MAASPTAMDTQDKWSPADAQGTDTMGPAGSADSVNGAPADGQGAENPDFTRGSSVSGGSKADASFREKQVKVLRVSSCLSEWILGMCCQPVFLCLSFCFNHRLVNMILKLLLPTPFQFLCSRYYCNWTGCLLSAV